uniref:Uncharacterized protein n=1 Tax=Alexandrium catenella TaxID=2925 RepID=A0A7S1W8Z3_ALECA|mmetsp:Transcript_43521/g.117376  ORF Transcript_43521/g.117376 Transcript_43521/m.117376 type:complete len:502 (+) Transcript_43521:118-1623(+)
MISALRASIDSPRGMDSPRKARLSRLSFASEANGQDESWMAVGGALRRGQTTGVLGLSRLSMDDSSIGGPRCEGLKRSQTAPMETLDSLVAENESLGERVFELEEQNRLLLSATRELEELRAEVAEHDLMTSQKTMRGSLKQSLANAEMRLLQMESRCDEAEKSAKAEEEAREQMQQKLSDAEARKASMHDELVRLNAHLAEMQKQEKLRAAELESAQSNLQQVNSTLEYERQCLSQEREKVHNLEEEVDDLSASRAGQSMHGRKSRAGKRLVTYNLMSQLDLQDIDDEEDEEDDDEQVAEDEPAAASVEVLRECEELREQLASFSKEKEAAVAEAEDLRTQLSNASKEREAALAEVQGLKTKLSGESDGREAALAEAQAAISDLHQQLGSVRCQRDEALARKEAARASAMAASSSQRVAEDAERGAPCEELRQRTQQLERALELERKASKAMRAELNSPWWNRLSCMTNRPRLDGEDWSQAPQPAATQGLPGVQLQMPAR